MQLYCRFSLLLLLFSTGLVSQNYCIERSLQQCSSCSTSIAISEKCKFWKKIYAEVDSFSTVVFDKSTLHIYTVVNSPNVVATVDSLKRMVKHPGRIMVKQGRKEFVINAIKRATAYWFVVDSLSAHDLHHDLRWLPVLESGYLDTMVSDQDARGIWQFIPSTWKRYGFTPDQITDSRIATSVFIRYFLALYRQFGDYALAITAYHHGENGINEKLLKRCASSDTKQSLETILPDLGFQSANYYAKFLAITDIAHSLSNGILPATQSSEKSYLLSHENDRQ